MTFDNTAWAINGALLGSSIARRAEFAATSGGQGIVQRGDLKVTQLATPGVGLLVNEGVALVRNEYQDNPSETYVVSNPGTHTIPSGSMPGSSPSARSYILAVVVGDPDFSQVNHPWMGSDDPPIGQEQSFNYVRPTLIQVADDTVTSLDVQYPALPLARIDIPANTTTITDAMITDLRSLAQPRQSQEIFVSPPNTWTAGSPRLIPSGSSFSDWGPQEFKPEVKVPEWATRAIVVVTVNGVRLKDNTVNVAGNIRAQLGSVSGANVAFDYEADSGANRVLLIAAHEYDVTSIAGDEVFVRVEGYQNVPGSPSDNRRLRLQGGSQMVFDIRFFEE